MAGYSIRFVRRRHDKALTIKSSQTNLQRYLRPLLERIAKGEIDPSYIITHRLPLEEAARGYKIFRDKQEGCVKLVLKRGMPAANSTNGDGLA